MSTVLAGSRSPQTTQPGQGRQTLTAIAPMVPVQNVAVSRRFYVDRLGFRVLQENANATAALVARGRVRLMLIRVGAKRVLDTTREHLSAYVWTLDVDALYREIGPALADLPAHRVRPPFTQPYGAREFHVKDPDGFLLFFAEDPFGPEDDTTRQSRDDGEENAVH
ncbi:MAG: VOC family protein [Pseudomonadota bacterium]